MTLCSLARSTMSTTDSMSVDWTTAKIPAYDELPHFRNFPGCAWSVWGAEDQPLVKQSAAREIRFSLNWQLIFDLNEQPMFGRRPPEVNFIQKQKEGLNYSRDDEIHINTQSGTQWDGLRHFPMLEHEMFYNNTPASTLPRGLHSMPDPHQIDQTHTRIGIQNWADHGICGRGVLLDLVKFLSKDGVLPYDPWTTHAITVPELQACAEAQGISFQRGDILMLRVGFIKKYYESTQESRDALRGKPETFAGIEQSEEMKRFLWLWGMPIGEFVKLAKVCAEYGRYTFFVSSWPLNM
ncbi:hypothetical protein B0H14DRAFT_2837511 [Mycena olivaceomarginata]|nr:hypothetical protein B0H14DRAFT_2837511 [Mycena olivaceomarginata]